MSDSPPTTDEVPVHDGGCGSRLRVYQPEGHHPVVYCPGCESPYLVHCRDATQEDVK